MKATNQQSIKAGVPEKQEGQLGYMARYYDTVMWFMTLGREKKLRQLTVRLAGLKPGDTVLEVGSGTGSLTIAIKKQVGEAGKAFGIDLAPEMVEVARRKAERNGVDVNFQQGSIAQIPFPDDNFGFVVCSFMIFHMPEDVRRAGLKEILRVLKPAGYLFVLDLALPDNKLQRTFVENHFGSMMQHDVRELAPALKESCFSEIEMENAGFMGAWYIRAKASKANTSA